MIGRFLKSRSNIREWILIGTLLACSSAMVGLNFNFSTRIVAQAEASQSQTDQKPNPTPETQTVDQLTKEKFNERAAFLGAAFYVFFLWSYSTIKKNLIRLRSKKIEELFSNYRFDEDMESRLNEGVLHSTQEDEGRVLGLVVIKLILSLFPGLLLYWSFGNWPYLMIYLVAGLIGFLIWRVRSGSRMFRSPGAFESFIHERQKKWAPEVEKGFVTEASLGVYRYTDLYYGNDGFLKELESRRPGGGRASSRW